MQGWNDIEIDKEWVELIKEAFSIGITKEEILKFLLNPESNEGYSKLKST